MLVVVIMSKKKIDKYLIGTGYTHVEHSIG